MCIRDSSNDALVDVEQVVGPAVALLHDDLAAGDALGGEEVEVLLLVLDRPPGIGELAVDEHACALLSRQFRIVVGSHYRSPYWGEATSTSRGYRQSLLLELSLIHI